jgi:spermidine synthase
LAVSAPVAGTPAPTVTPTARRWLALLATLFFCSGAAGLVDQVVWLRFLSLVFGNTTLATATLLAVFLGGLGGGAWAFGRLASRVRRPLAAYGVVELGVALWALASPRLFDLIDLAYVAIYREVGAIPALFSLARVLLAAAALGPPTVLMGGSLPLLLAAASRRDAGGEGGRMTAMLYGVNTLGAVAGVAFAGFFAIRVVGLWATLVVASTAQAVVALVAVLASFALAKTPGGGAAATRSGPLEAGGLRGLHLAAFTMGACSLAAEVLWTRILVFYFGSSVYAYSLMLVLFLLGVGLGSALATPFVSRWRPLVALAWIEAAMMALAVASVPLFGALDGRLTWLSETVRPHDFASGVLVQLLAALPIVLPPTLLMGASFPLVVAAALRGGRGLGRSAGAVYAANTTGSIVGSLGAGFALVPLLGSQNSLLAIGAVNGALAAWFATRERSARRWRWALLGVVPLAAAPLFAPDRVILSAGIFRHDRPGDLLHFHEDTQAAVAVRRLREPAGEYLSLELNGINVAGTSRDLYAVQLMQGHLPLLLGAPDVERVVHIGFGSGGTAHAVSLHPVREIRIVEISPAVLAASDRWFASINRGVLADPRVRVEINDGRNFLLATPERFDVVLSDSIHPRYAGNGALYSREYFELLAARLEPGGVASMWLPTYALTTRNYAQIVRAFRDVFPQTVIWYEASEPNAFTIVTGKRGGAAWDAAAVAAAMRAPGVRDALASLGFAGPADLVACYLAGPPELDRFLAGVPPHVDDLPAVEYESGTLFVRDRTWRQTFAALLASRPAEPPAALLAGLEPGERERAWRLWQERGTVLHRHLAWLQQRLVASADMR